MKKLVLLLTLALILMATPALAQTIGPTCNLKWLAVTQNADGTPLTVPISTYRVYLQSSPTPVPVPGTSTFTAVVNAPTLLWNCAGITSGQKYVWVTAVNANGESDVQTSPLAFVYVGTKPATPPGLTVTP